MRAPKATNWTTRALCVALLLSGSAVMAGQQGEAPPRPRGATAVLSPAEIEVWRSLARSRFITGDVKGALDALNKIGEPRVGSVEIEGLLRTGREVTKQYLGLQPGDLLTSGRLTRLERRIEELPVASSAKIRYDAVDGTATVRPIVVERNLMPATPVDTLPVAAKAVVLREVRLQVSDPTGRGELWSPSYRWAANRPRVVLHVAAPAPGALPGLAQFEATWQRETYRSSSFSGGLFKEDRVRVGGALSDWITSWLRWQGGAAVDRIGDVTYAGLNVGVNTRFGDHLALIANGGQWYGLEGADPFRKGELAITARSTTKRDVPTFTAQAGIALAAPTTPLAISPGVGASQGRGILLRAHPLHTDGIIRLDRLGKEIRFASAEYSHPVATPIGFVDLAGFVDAARVTPRVNTQSGSALNVDIGTGVRFNISRAGDKVRFDVGYGIRDGRVAVSADYVQPWGVR